MLLNTTKDDAQANCARNRGNQKEWFEHKATYRDPSPNLRLRNQAKEIYAKNQATVQTVVQRSGPAGDPQQYYGAAAGADEVPHIVRLRSAEAQRIADNFQNQPEKWFDFEGNKRFRPASRPIRAYPEENQDLARKLNRQSYGTKGCSEDERAPANRVGNSEARDNQQRNRAVQTAQLIATREAAIQEQQRRNERVRSGQAQSDEEKRQPRHPRVKLEATENAIKNRGSAHLYGTHHGADKEWSDDADLRQEAMRGFRCPSADARGNYDRSRGRAAAICFDHRTQQTPSPRQYRVNSSEATQNLARNLDGFYSRKAPPDGAGCGSGRAKSKTRPEGEENLEKAKGSVSKCFNQQENMGYSSPQPKGRAVCSEGAAFAQKNKGELRPNESNYLNPAHKKKLQTRSLNTEAANENSCKNAGKSFEANIKDYGRGDAATEAAAKKPPRGAMAAEAASSLATGLKHRTGSVGNLLAFYGKHGAEQQRPMRLQGNDASFFADKHRGSDISRLVQA